MSDLLTHIERSELVDVDLDLEPQCESEFHESGGVPGWYQTHGGPASHYQVAPCVHGCGLRCQPHVETIRREGGRCHVCRVGYPPEAVRFIEL